MCRKLAGLTSSVLISRDVRPTEYDVGFRYTTKEDILPSRFYVARLIKDPMSLWWRRWLEMSIWALHGSAPRCKDENARDWDRSSNRTVRANGWCETQDFVSLTGGAV